MTYHVGPGEDCHSNRRAAELFAEFMVEMIVRLGGEKSTAYACAAAWWTAIEHGEFGA